MDWSRLSVAGVESIYRLVCKYWWKSANSSRRYLFIKGVIVHLAGTFEDLNILASLVLVEYIKLRSTVGSGRIASHRRLAVPSITIQASKSQRKVQIQQNQNQQECHPQMMAGASGWGREMKCEKLIVRVLTLGKGPKANTRGTRVPDRAGDYINASDLSTNRSVKF